MGDEQNLRSTPSLITRVNRREKRLTIIENNTPICPSLNYPVRAIVTIDYLVHAWRCMSSHTHTQTPVQKGDFEIVHASEWFDRTHGHNTTGRYSWMMKAANIVKQTSCFFPPWSGQKLPTTQHLKTTTSSSLVAQHACPMSVTRRQKGRVIGFGLVLHRAREENWETNKTSPASGGIYFSKLSRVESRRTEGTMG